MILKSTIKTRLHSVHCLDPTWVRTLSTELAYGKTTAIQDSDSVPHDNSKTRRLESLRRRLIDESVSTAHMFPLKKAITPRKTWVDILHQAKEKFDRHLSSNAQSSDSLSSAVLTDTFNRKHTYLRISLVERCNLRCQYCMPPDGIKLQEESKLLRADEIKRIANLFIQSGVDKVRYIL
jgi:sulfatase maturation enzyme AslB (radical SAM superfamily)